MPKRGRRKLPTNFMPAIVLWQWGHLKRGNPSHQFLADGIYGFAWDWIHAVPWLPIV